MPLVSVIIPTYNRESFIKECIESVLHQTFSDFELIVVDDGSTDDTDTIINSFGSKVQFIKQANQGPSAARNTGIRLAAGNWICFLDSDDLWLPKKLERQVEFIRKFSEIKVCYTEEIWYRKGRRVNAAKKHQKFSGRFYKKMLSLCLISPSSVLIHRSVFENAGLFDQSLPACEDYDLWLRIGARYSIDLILEPLIIKRNGHDGQQSMKFWGMDRFRIQALKKIIDSNILTIEDKNATVTMLKQKCSILANGCEKRGKLDQAAYYRNFATHSER